MTVLIAPPPRNRDEQSLPLHRESTRRPSGTLADARCRRHSDKLPKYGSCPMSLSWLRVRVVDGDCWVRFALYSTFISRIRYRTTDNSHSSPTSCNTYEPLPRRRPPTHQHRRYIGFVREGRLGDDVSAEFE